MNDAQSLLLAEVTKHVGRAFFIQQDDGGWVGSLGSRHTAPQPTLDAVTDVLCLWAMKFLDTVPARDVDEAMRWLLARPNFRFSREVETEGKYIYYVRVGELGHEDKDPAVALGVVRWLVELEEERKAEEK